MNSRADPGFEKGECAGGSGARTKGFLGGFKEFGPKRDGRAPSPPPLDLRLNSVSCRWPYAYNIFGIGF